MPRRVSVVSLSHPRTIETAIATYDVHQVAPELFGGYTGTDRDGYVARAEKAVFDTIYVRAAAGGKAHFPEVYLPRGFDRGELRR